MNKQLIDALRLHYENIETSRWITDSEGNKGIEYFIDNEWKQLIIFRDANEGNN